MSSDTMNLLPFLELQRNEDGEWQVEEGRRRDNKRRERRRGEAVAVGRLVKGKAEEVTRRRWKTSKERRYEKLPATKAREDEGRLTHDTHNRQLLSELAVI